ncbi:MAG: hypothetical protein L0H96_15350 [Humibacillus sp.]|nr:hypothetical protein [Humibacillus sp.]MDN5778278.1 hypothetical protein [Humibacillus sp.]
MREQHHEADVHDETRRGRLFLVTGARASGTTAVGAALARSFDRAVAIDAAVFDQMVVAGQDPYRGPHQDAHHVPPRAEQLRQLFLRWSAAIATAETYQLEGFDAVISDTVLGGHLEDFLDLASPETLHVVVLDPGGEGRAAVHDDVGTPRWGLWVDNSGQTADETVTTVLVRLAESVVATDSSA